MRSQVFLSFHTAPSCPVLGSVLTLASTKLAQVPAGELRHQKREGNSWHPLPPCWDLHWFPWDSLGAVLPHASLPGPALDRASARGRNQPRSWRRMLWSGVRTGESQVCHASTLGPMLTCTLQGVMGQCGSVLVWRHRVLGIHWLLHPSPLSCMRHGSVLVPGWGPRVTWVAVWRHGAPRIPWVLCLHARTHTDFHCLWRYIKENFCKQKKTGKCSMDIRDLILRGLRAHAQGSERQHSL